MLEALTMNEVAHALKFVSSSSRSTSRIRAEFPETQIQGWTKERFQPFLIPRTKEKFAVLLKQNTDLRLLRSF
jgi:hypothetical protein